MSDGYTPSTGPDDRAPQGGHRPPPAPAYPAYPGAAPGGAPGAPRPTDQGPPDQDNHLGVWSFALGLAGFLVFSVLTGIPAIIVGAKARAAAAQGRATNRGLATAGIVLGWLSVVFLVLTIALGVWLVQSGRWEEFLDAFGSLETMGAAGS